jgi:hypothetical protein
MQPINIESSGSGSSADASFSCCLHTARFVFWVYVSLSLLFGLTGVFVCVVPQLGLIPFNPHSIPRWLLNSQQARSERDVGNTRNQTSATPTLTVSELTGPLGLPPTPPQRSAWAGKDDAIGVGPGGTAAEVKTSTLPWWTAQQNSSNIDDILRVMQKQQYDSPPGLESMMKRIWKLQQLNETGIFFVYTHHSTFLDSFNSHSHSPLHACALIISLFYIHTLRLAQNDRVQRPGASVDCLAHVEFWIRQRRAHHVYWIRCCTTLQPLILHAA